MAVRVAVDAMGGDHAPGVVVEGVLRALARAEDDELAVVLVGPEARLLDEIDAHETTRLLPIEILHAPEVIEMDEAPTAAVKGKPDSSIHRGLLAHKSGRADAFVSAGNTGAVMAASLFILGRLPDVARPALLSFFPTTENACLVVDVGSNVDCKPEHLVQFARMGSLYARTVQQRAIPRVALLNIGEEPGKGNELVKETYPLLEQAADLHFVGNVEGRDVLHHGADVIVCDGFVGNVILKFGESMATAMVEMVRQEMQKQACDAAQQEVVTRVIGGIKKRFNPEEYGGAPLLGVQGNVLIGHGSSSPRAIERLVLTAAEVARQDVAGALAAALHP